MGLFYCFWKNCHIAAKQIWQWLTFPCVIFLFLILFNIPLDVRCQWPLSVSYKGGRRLVYVGFCAGCRCWYEATKCICQCDVAAELRKYDPSCRTPVREALPPWRSRIRRWSMSFSASTSASWRTCRRRRSGFWQRRRPPPSLVRADRRCYRDGGCRWRELFLFGTICLKALVWSTLTF